MKELPTETLADKAREFLKNAVIEPPIMKEAFVELMAKFAMAQAAHLVEENRKLREALEHYADEKNWQEPNAGEIVAYCVWEDFGNDKLRNGYDIVRATLEEADKTEVEDGT